MAIVKMKKLELSLVSTIRARVFQELQEAGCVHLQNVTSSQDVADASYVNIELDDLETEEMLSSLEDSIDFLQSHIPVVKAGMLESMSAVPPSRSLQEMQELYNSFPLEEVLKDIRSLEQEYKDTEARIAALSKEEADLSIWKNVGLDLDSIHGNNPYTGGMAGYIPRDTLSRFSQELQQASPYLDILVADTTPNEVYLYIIYAKSEEEAVREKIKDLGFAGMAVSDRKGDLRAVLEDITAQLKRLRSRLEVFRVLIIDSAEHLDSLKLLHDLLLIHQQGQEAQGQGVQTQTVSFFQGWVPVPQIEKIVAILGRHQELEYSLTDPVEAEYEDVPILLENKKIFKPFEPLTRMYGLPMYGTSLDPTPHLSPFYFLFYGFCLGDFFYGLIMMFLFGFLAIKSRKNAGTSAFMSMLALAGLSSAAFGVVFGSYFGNLFTEYIKVPLLANPGLINTLDKPMLVLYIALILGAVHLLYGLVVNMFSQMRKNALDAIFDNLSWMVFLSGFFTWLVLVRIGELVQITLPAMYVPNAATAGIFTTLMLIGAGLIVLNSIRKALAKGPLGIITGFLGGLWELYEATGFLSDLLSYARLLALGLATGVIANVFNFLSFDMVMKGMGPALGIPLGIILLLIGHMFNLVLSAFGAFVHSLRLQFVEFFSKFMEAGGREFQPLKQEGSYYNVQNIQKDAR